MVERFLLAQKRDQASKQLQKALDRRHRLIVNQFNKARTTDELRTALGRSGPARGDPRRVLGGADTSPGI